MAHWRQHITNAERRGRRNQRCVHAASEATTTVRCDDNSNQFEYGYEAKLAPRCATGPVGRPDVSDRGVFYALRKTLHCAMKAAAVRPRPKIKRPSPPSLPKVLAPTGKAPPASKSTDALRRQQKLHQLELKRRRTNGLRFQLQWPPQRHPGLIWNPISRPEPVDNEMSNDLFG